MVRQARFLASGEEKGEEIHNVRAAPDKGCALVLVKEKDQIAHEAPTALGEYAHLCHGNVDPKQNICRPSKPVSSSFCSSLIHTQHGHEVRSRPVSKETWMLCVPWKPSLGEATIFFFRQSVL